MVLKNTESITEKIKGLAYANNKILIVIDDVHSQKAALIFNVIKNIQSLNKEKKENVLFLLAARIPEFYWALERNLYQDYTIIENINSLFDEHHKYSIKNFDKQDVKEFIKKYQSFLNPLIKNNSLKQNTDEIFKYTQGHPIMVRFAALNEGLTPHVEKMYLEYLVDRKNENYPHVKRLETVILNSLFDISNVTLKDETLNDFDLIDVADELRDTMIRKTGDVWKTIHLLWDVELFRYVFSLKQGARYIENSFRNMAKGIILSEKIDDSSKLSILNTVYSTLTIGNVLKLETIEKIIDLKDIDNKLDNFSKVVFYGRIIGGPYYELRKYDKAIEYLDTALHTNSNDATALYNKGLVLNDLGRYNEAIECYDKSLAIRPDYPDALINKGLILNDLGKYNEAIECYDKSLAIRPDDATALYNKGLVLYNLGKHNEAIECYDKALKIKPDNADALNNKGLSLYNLGKHNEAIECYDKALKIKPDYVYASYNKGNALYNLGKYNEAIECYDKALSVNPDYVNALTGKGLALGNLGKYNEAIECYDKALSVNSDHVNVLNNKGNALYHLGKYSEAINWYDNALRISPHDVDALNGKGVALGNLGKYNEAIEWLDKALEINPDFTFAKNNKQLVLKKFRK